MNDVATAPALDERKELAAKRKYVEIIHVPASQLPYRIHKRNTGVCLRQLETEEEVTTFLKQVSLDSLKAKPKRRLSR